ncbi:MAG: TetR family transcriptional regulator [Bacteroidia bacterium]|nr:MAG: TetR family transcriptional regulator [Bacteroidia bacterium]
MNVKDNILSAAQELFFKKGIKSVTVDDIAAKLKISKKTIYETFENKDAIVFELVKAHLNHHKELIEKLIEQSDNIIEETMNVVRCSSEMMNHINPVVFEDLKTYYPKVWKYLEDFKASFIMQTIIKGLEKGQKQGLIRKDINIKLIAYLRLLQINLLFETDILEKFNLTFNELQNQLTKHFLYGIATEKGIKIIQQSEP